MTLSTTLSKTLSTTLSKCRIYLTQHPLIASVCVVVIIAIVLYFVTASNINTNTNELYKRLMDDFSLIFPDRNRNAGGAQFYNHIVETLQPSYDDFLQYHKMYCAVSGSPIDPKRTDAYTDIVIKDIDDKEIFGRYYRCCSPCVCDITKYARVERHTYDGNPIYVFVINDPCVSPQDIPDSVTAFTCDSQNKTTNGSFTESGRLIMGVLYDAVPYDSSIHGDAQQTMETSCASRYAQDPDKLQGGMGTIFVSLATIDPL